MPDLEYSEVPVPSILRYVDPETASTARCEDGSSWTLQMDSGVIVTNLNSSNFGTLIDFLQALQVELSASRD